MIFPLGPLYSYVLNTLDICKYSAGNDLPEEEEILRSLEIKVMEAKLALFTSLVKTTYLEQVSVILQASNLALAGMQKKVMQQMESEQREDRASLHRGVLEQLDELSDFLEENFGIPAALANPNSGKQQPGAGKAKLATNLTAAQLALFLRLWAEAEIIAGMVNVTQLCVNVAGAVTIRDNKPVTADSLRIKYYKQDMATITIVRGHLQNMLRLLQDYSR